LRCLKRVRESLVGIIATSLILGSCSKQTPTSIENPPTESPIEILTSNQNGNITLQNGKVVHLKKENTQIPISEQEAICFTGENYQTIITKKGEYHQTILSSNNSETDTLELKDTQTHEFDIRIIEDSQNLFFNFSKDILEERFDLDRTSGCEIYKGTTSGEEALLAYSVAEGILMYVGVDWIATIVGEVYELAGATGDLEFKEFLLENNWDSYFKETIVSEQPFISTKTHFRYPSNQPELTLENLVEESTTLLYFTGLDKTIYENPLHDTVEDKTITCRGPTENLDFNYVWELYDSQDNLIDSGSNQAQELTLTFSLPSGNYKLKTTLHDDTFWKNIYDDSGTNSSQLETFFTVGENLETIIMQPGPENGKDTFIRIEEVCDLDWNCDEYHKNDNYGQEETLRSSMRIHNIRHYDNTITLIQFNISQIQENSQIENATLELYGTITKTNYENDCGEARISCYNMESSWSESTANFNNSFYSIDTSYKIDEIIIPYNSDQQPQWISLNVTSQVQNWISSIDPNYGLAIGGRGIGCSVSGLENIPSSEYYGDSTLRPKLTIQYLE